MKIRIMQQKFSDRALPEEWSIVTDQLRDAASCGVEHMVYPEFWGYPLKEDVSRVSRDVLPKYIDQFVEACRKEGVSATAGFPTPAPDGRVFSSMLTVTKDDIYWTDKFRPFGSNGNGESWILSDGSRSPIVHLGKIKAEVIVCYDLRFAERFFSGVSQGVQMFIVGASWVPGEHKRSQWETLIKARAIECNAWIIACGSASGNSLFDGTGFSAIISPKGEVLDQLDEKEGMLDCNVEMPSEQADIQREATAVYLNR